MVLSSVSSTRYPGGALATATTNEVAGRYTFDEVGNLTGETATPEGEADTESTLYAYDEANRLTSTIFDPGDGSLPVTTLYGFDTSNAWRTSQGPQSDPGARPVQMSYNALGRLASYANSDTAATATYTYDGAGQRTQSAVTVAGVTTTTSFAYDELALMYLSAVQGATTWRIDYLHDEEGVPFGGVYRSPATSTDPTSLRSGDGGATWRRTPVFEDAEVYALAFASPTLGWAVGGELLPGADRRGLILATTDGGVTGRHRGRSRASISQT
jgi:YD repeat-containing protein